MAVVATAGLTGSWQERADATDGGLEIVGTIPPHQVVSIQAGTARPSPMIVDDTNNLGFALGFLRSPEGVDELRIAMYDLESLELLDHTAAGQGRGPLDVLSWAIDPDQNRILVVGASKTLNGRTCAPDGTQTLTVLRYVVEGGVWRFPKPSAFTTAALPCPNGLFFIADAASIFEDAMGRKKVYLTGAYEADAGARTLVKALPGNLDTVDNDAQELLVRQIDIDTLSSNPADALDWEIDLRYAGCGRRVTYFVGRARDSVLTYCADATPAQFHSPAGELGYVVRIPLDSEGMPLTVGGAPPLIDPSNPSGITNAEVRRTPALSGAIQPFVDGETGRMLLLTNDKVNGNAVWVFDPFAERFIGVMTHGEAEAAAGKNGVGFDLLRGRAYLFSPAGFIVGPARQNPPLSGLRYEVLGEPADLLSTPTIAVASSLRRLVVPMMNRGYVVLRDDIQEPAATPRGDPDRLTAQVAEVGGITSTNASGAALGSGVHVVVAGGLTKALNQADPMCNEVEVRTGLVIEPLIQEVLDFNERTIFDGECIWEQFITSGHREFSLGATSAEASTSAGSTATGQGFAFASGDRASDRDIKSLSECKRTSLQGSTTDVVDHFSEGNPEARRVIEELFRPPLDDDGDGEPDQSNDRGSPYYIVCTQAHEAAGSFSIGPTRFPDFSSGVEGRDGTGFPAPRAACTRSSGATEAERGMVTMGESDGFGSNVSCDGSRPAARAFSESAAVRDGDSGDTVAVGNAASEIITVRTPDRGMVTVAAAWASDVRVGPLTIGTVRSVAVVRARGRSGTAAATLERALCDVSVNGLAVVEGCVSASSDEARALLDSLNQGLQRVRFDVPRASSTGTPGGYQAVVTKDPSVQAADKAVNDDDSNTISALQVVFYNDGPEGRNRVIVQLAGVHAEARYGIFLIPNFANPLFAAPAFSATPTESIARLAGRPATSGRPDEVEYISGTAAASRRALPDEVQFKQADRSPFGVLRSALAWLLNHPLEAALLFAMWALLASPVYLGIRRRSFTWAVTLEEEFR